MEWKHTRGNVYNAMIEPCRFSSFILHIVETIWSYLPEERDLQQLRHLGLEKTPFWYLALRSWQT